MTYQTQEVEGETTPQEAASETTPTPPQPEQVTASVEATASQSEQTSVETAKPAEKEESKKPKTYPAFVLKGYETKDIRQLFTAVATIQEEVTFQLGQSTVETKHMDPSHVSMVALKMPKEYFVEYDVVADTTLSMDLPDLLKIISKAKNGDSIILSRKGGFDPKLYISLQGKLTRNYDMCTLDITSEILPPPKLEYMVKANINIDALSEALAELEGVSDQVEVKATKEGLTFKGSSETSTLNIPLLVGDPLLYSYDLREESRALYGLAFLKDMVKALKPLSDQVMFEFSSSRPCKLSPVLVNGVELTYYLAPKVE